MWLPYVGSPFLSLRIEFDKPTCDLRPCTDYFFHLQPALQAAYSSWTRVG